MARLTRAQLDEVERQLADELDREFGMLFVGVSGRGLIISCLTVALAAAGAFAAMTHMANLLH